MHKSIMDFFTYYGLESGISSYLSVFIMLIAMFFLCWLANAAAKKIISRAVYKIVKKSRNLWDDMLYENKVFGEISHIAPALVIMAFTGYFPFWREFLNKFAMIYLTLIGYITIDRLIDSVECIYKTYEVAKEKPITSYLQVLKIFCVIVCLIISVGVIVEKSPWTLLSGIGAMTAVLMVIFKDTIMGLSAGIQLSVNKMLHIGDWIEMSKYGADGEVIEITLNTVKVQNWDKTIIMIPVYNLISEPFKNWRGMYAAGGRRIKRSVYIDVSSIKFCPAETLEGYRRSAFLAERLETGFKAIDERRHSVEEKESKPENPPEGGACELTNVAVFRAYITGFLKKHPAVNDKMHIMARLLQPCEHGLPVEIYAFCRRTEWEFYEAVQAEITEHLLAIAPSFDLKIYQKPAGADSRTIK